MGIFSSIFGGEKNEFLQKAFEIYQAGDHAQSAEWFHKAAEQGVAEAQHNLGLMYANGHGVTQDSAARHTEPILHAWGLSYYLIEADADAERISTAFQEAGRTERPVVCLIGAEYG